MVNCIRFVNSRFISNAYILYKEEETDIWLIDPGDTEPIFEWLLSNKKSIKGILLTHAHFDHIYGVNGILEKYPTTPIYVANETGREILFDAKRNGSKFTEEGGFVISNTADIRMVDEEMQLWKNITINAFITPGHSEDSVCYLIEDRLFTGDTLIKDIRTVTKLKSGSVDKLATTIDFLSELKGRGLIVMGGHEDSFDLDRYDLSVAINNPLNKN